MTTKTPIRPTKPTGTLTPETERLVQSRVDAYCPGLAELMSELKAAAEGETIVVISSDPGCRTDIPLWVQRSGNELLAIENVVGGAVRFIVRKHIRR